MGNRKIRFHVSIVIAIAGIVIAATLATMLGVYFVGTRAATETADALFADATQRTSDRVDRLVARTLDVASLGASLGGMEEVAGDGRAATALPFLFQALDNDPALYSLYFGYANGNFLQVINTRGDSRVIAAVKAPAKTIWVVRAITENPGQNPGQNAGGRVQTWSFLDSAGHLIDSTIDPHPDYDPRQRPWYGTAMAAGAPQFTQPYVFNSTNSLGITASHRLASGGGVFGADVTLSTLNDFVESETISRHGGILVFDNGYHLLSMSRQLGAGHAAPGQLADLRQSDSPIIRAVVGLASDPSPAMSSTVTLDGQTLMVRVVKTSGPDIGGIHVAAAAPIEDFVGYIRRMQIEIALISLLAMAILLPVAGTVSRRMSKMVSGLAEDARRVRNLDFSGHPPHASRILEFDLLGEAFELMKRTLAAETVALGDSQLKLAKLVDLGIAISAERDGTRLMDMILLGAKELANADGGTVYRRDDHDNLHFQILRNDTLGVILGVDPEKPITLPPVAMRDADGRPNHRNVVSHAVHENKTINIPNAYESGEFDFAGTRAFDARNHYRSQSFMTVPLKPRGGEVIGALQLINARDHESGEIIPFPQEIQRFVEALAALAATALYNRELLDAQDALMDAMIQLIAGAIDAKSPYTGGHCARVPELAVMLARAASDAPEGPLAEFRFSTDEEWREFRVGAWLHDCGKVVTPEFVVDKATKLETIHNRIHEIRARFEILLRDAEIARLNAIRAGEDETLAARHFEERRDQLAEDFAFIAECNVGGEFMAPEKVERLKRIAMTSWVRHFDDRLGLSYEELKRIGDLPATPLPATEHLLADKPEHIVPRDPSEAKRYDGLGFKLRIPTHLYDHGEVHNLSISRGTLNDEERFKINEHIMQTIAMLEHMPFPKPLRRVPEYAGTHHETLIGTGYPRRLTKDELSVPSRVMAIADIFEALTASDRPYKKAKTLSESIKILSFMKKDGHIDPDLFDLFLTSGVYLAYAERFLKPDQIDEVDISTFVTPAPARVAVEAKAAEPQAVA